MRDHIKILGILNIIMGSLTALIGLVGFLAMGTIAGIIATTMRSASGSDFQDGMAAAPIAAAIAVAVAVFFFALGLPAIIGGWGLVHYRPWSRILMIVISVLHLFHIPLGTALGAYGLWVLLNEDGRRVLESGGAYVPVPRPAYGPAGPTV